MTTRIIEYTHGCEKCAGLLGEIAFSNDTLCAVRTALGEGCGHVTLSTLPTVVRSFVDGKAIAWLESELEHAQKNLKKSTDDNAWRSRLLYDIGDAAGLSCGDDFGSLPKIVAAMKKDCGCSCSVSKTQELISIIAELKYQVELLNRELAGRDLR